MNTKVALDNKLLVSALQSATDSVLIKDLEGNVLIGSKMVANCFGVSVEQLPGLNVYQFLTSEQADMLRKVSEEIQRTGKTQASEEEWVVDGISYFLLATRSPIFDNTGSVVAILTIYKDISPLKQAYDAIESSQLRYATLAETCPVGIFECDENQLIRFVNSEWCRIVGLPAQQVIGQHWIELIRPDDRPRVLENLVQPIASNPRDGAKIPRRLDCWVHSENSCFVEVSINPVVVEKGAPTGYIGAFVDLSYRCSIERSMRETATRLKLLTAAVPAMIWQLNGDLECCFVNDHFEEVTGRAVDSALGYGWRDIVSPSQREMVHEELNRSVTQRIPTQFQHVLSTLRGDRIFMSFVRPMQDPEGKLLGLAGHSVDITDQYKTQETLERAKLELETRVQERTQELVSSNDSLRREISQRQLAQELLHEKQTQLDQVARISMLGRLSGELAHELNQPLNAIQNYASALEQLIRELNSPSILAIASQLQSEVQRAAGIVRRTRDFISAGRREHVPLAIEKPLTEVVSLLHQEASRRGMRIELEVLATDSRCLGDPVGLQQAFANLILNGMDAMVESPSCDHTICIALKRVGKWLCVSVSDTGDGVAEPSRLFDSFYTTKADGLGMGLAISTAIAREHSGSLEYHPRVPKGSVFEFRIPFASTPS